MTAYKSCNPALPDLDIANDTLEWNSPVRSGVYLCLNIIYQTIIFHYI